MQSFNWVSVDSIRYNWDGEGNITCSGSFGYHVSIAGDRIDELEIENEFGDIAGSLSIDFAQATIRYQPEEGVESATSLVLVGHQQGESEYLITDFYPSMLQDLLAQTGTIEWFAHADAESFHDFDLSPLPLAEGRPLSWDSFEFNVSSDATIAVVKHDYGTIFSDTQQVSISLDLTNQMFEHLSHTYNV